MLTTLLVELVLVGVVAGVAGYWLGKRDGALVAAGTTLIGNAILLSGVLYPPVGLFPFAHLEPTVGRFYADTASYLVNTCLVLEVGFWSTALAVILGYFLSQLIGALEFGGAAVIASALCLFAAAGPSLILGPLSSGWTLVMMIVLIGTFGVWAFSAFALQGKGASTLALWWWGLCLSSWLGYRVAGHVGLVFITLPTQLIFWALQFFLSGYILPFAEEGKERQEQRLEAFRALITFRLGTNYPYYVIEDWKQGENKDKETPDPQVAGNPFRQFFSGPGIILTRCDQLVVVSDGGKLQVRPPGLSFTHVFERLYAAVDLRPQLRGKTIKAETKDGIGVGIFTFMPHRIAAEGEMAALGQSYSFNKVNVQQAVYDRSVIEHTWDRDAEKQVIEELKRAPWDALVLTLGPPILKEIIAKYTCDELHAPGDPRTEIATTYKQRMKAKMAALGIQMVGGGISNIVVDEEATQQRLRNWEATWKHRMEIAIGEADAEIARQIEGIWAKMQLALVEDLAKILYKAEHEGMRDEVLALLLIEAIGAKVPTGDAGGADSGESLRDIYLSQFARRRSL